MKKILSASNNAVRLSRHQTLASTLEKLGRATNQASRQQIGGHFIHRVLGYRGVILATFPAEKYDKFEHEGSLHLNLVLVDEVDASSKYPTCSFSSLRHEKLNGGIICADLVKSTDILPYQRPHETIKNSSLERFFFPFTIFSSTGESNHTLLSPKLEVEQFQNGINKNSRVMESSVFVPELSVNGKITLTAFCLAQNETGTSNWLVSVNYVDQGAKIEFARVDLSVVEENENKMAFRAASPEGVDTDTVHFSRTIKLRSKNQLAFVRADLRYRKTGVSEWIKVKSSHIVLLGQSVSSMEDLTDPDH